MPEIHEFPLDREVLDCELCENTIVTVLQQTEGATTVEIDKSTASAVVEYDPACTDPDHISQTIHEWGYARD